MEFGDRRNEAKSKSISGRRAAPLKPI
jgi:hypothetical protein